MNLEKSFLLQFMIGGCSAPDVDYSISVSSNAPNPRFEGAGLTFVDGIAKVPSPGLYNIQCYADGYIAQQTDIRISVEQPHKSFYFELSEVVPDIDYSISLSANAPNPRFEGAGLTFVNGVAEPESPGTYTVMCYADGYVAQQTNVSVSEEQPQTSFHFELELEQNIPEDVPLDPEDFEKSTNVSKVVVDELPDVTNVYYEGLDGPGQAYLESLATPTSPVVRWSMGNKYHPGVQAWNPGYTVRYKKSDYDNKLATIGRTALKAEILEGIKKSMKETLFENTNNIGAFNEKKNAIYKPIDIERLKDPALYWQNYQGVIHNLDPYYANFGVDISTSVLTRDQIYSYITAMMINQLYPNWDSFADFVGITIDTDVMNEFGTYGLYEMIMQLEMEMVITPDSVVLDETYNNDVVLPIISELTNMEEIDRYEGTAYVFSAKKIEDKSDFQTISSLDDLKTWVNNVFTPEDPAEVLLLGPEFYSTISTDLSEGRKPKIDGLNVENVILQPTGKELQWVVEMQPPEKGQIAGERMYVGHFDNQGLSITPVEIEIEEIMDWDDDYMEEDLYINFYANYVVSQWNSYINGDFAIERRKAFMYNDPNLSN